MTSDLSQSNTKALQTVVISATIAADIGVEHVCDKKMLKNRCIFNHPLAYGIDPVDGHRLISWKSRSWNGMGFFLPSVSSNFLVHRGLALYYTLLSISAFSSEPLVSKHTGHKPPPDESNGLNGLTHPIS